MKLKKEPCSFCYKRISATLYYYHEFYEIKIIFQDTWTRYNIANTLLLLLSLFPFEENLQNLIRLNRNFIAIEHKPCVTKIYSRYKYTDNLDHFINTHETKDITNAY